MSAVRLAARAVLVSAFGFALVPVLGANPAYACSCIQSTEQENFERADVVFKGTMDDVEALSDLDGEQMFVFTPTRTYKGKTSTPQSVTTADNSAACGVELTGGGPFLVFAYENEDADAKAPLTTNLCSGTRELKPGEEPDFKVNKPVAVDEGPTEPAPGRPVEPTEAEKERLEAGSSGGGADPTPPCCKTMVDPDEPMTAPDEKPLNEPAVDSPPLGAPVPADGDAVDTPLMMQTSAVAEDSVATTAGESANAAADDDGNSAWAIAAAAALVAAGAAGTGWAVRRRRSL